MALIGGLLWCLWNGVPCCVLVSCSGENSLVRGIHLLNPAAAAANDMHTVTSSGRFEPLSCIWNQSKLAAPCMTNDTRKWRTITLTYYNILINRTEPRMLSNPCSFSTNYLLEKAISSLLLFEQRFSKFRKLSFICGLILWLNAGNHTNRSLTRQNHQESL